MEDPTIPQKGRKGRKRQSDEDQLTEEERIKKQKNRDAARKCREKKEREAKDLKEKNDELMKENDTLANEKKKLEGKVEHFMTVIQNHLAKGCRLPDNVKALWDQESKRTQEKLNEKNNFRPVGVIETSKAMTPPHSPESSTSGKSSPYTRRQSASPAKSSPSVLAQQVDQAPAPTALFSGVPLSEDSVPRRRYSSGSSTQSSSPAPSPPPQLVPERDLTHFLSSKQNLPQALAPISSLTKKQEARQASGNYTNGHVSQLTASVVQSVTSVMNENQTIVMMSGKYYIQTDKGTDGRGNRVLELSPIEVTDTADGQDVEMVGSQSNEVLQRAFEQPDIPIEDEVSKSMYMSNGNGCSTLANGTDHSMDTGTYDTGSNLPSLGFSCATAPTLPAGYSYTEDLQLAESANDIASAYSSTQETPAPVSRRNETDTATSEGQDMSLINTIAPVILDMYKDLSPSLHQQLIQKNTSFAGSTSVGNTPQIAAQNTKQIVSGNTTTNTTPLTQTLMQPQQLQQYQGVQPQQIPQQQGVQQSAREVQQTVPGRSALVNRSPVFTQPSALVYNGAKPEVSTTGQYFTQGGSTVQYQSTNSLQTNNSTQILTSASRNGPISNGQIARNVVQQNVASAMGVQMPQNTSSQSAPSQLSPAAVIQQTTGQQAQITKLPFSSNGYRVPAVSPNAQPKSQTLSWEPIPSSPQPNVTRLSSANTNLTHAVVQGALQTPQPVVQGSMQPTNIAYSISSQAPSSIPHTTSSLPITVADTLHSADFSLNLPSLGFNDLSSDGNIFDKKPRKVS